MNMHQQIDEGFSDVLKRWRKRRRVSQLELSSLASISSRHISFLERGRAKPSRDMVLKLGAALNIPPVEVNAGLTVAGFAHAYPSAKLNDENVRALQSVMITMLENQLPWPAVACDQSWEILRSNTAATHLFELLGLDNQKNLMHAMLGADDPQGPLLNWPKVAQLMLRRLDAEQLQRPDDVDLKRIRMRLANHPRLRFSPIDESQTLDVVVPITLRCGASQLSLISVVAQFGGVQEITYSGVHIEMFFPADKATETYFKQLGTDA